MLQGDALKTAIHTFVEVDPITNNFSVRTQEGRRETLQRFLGFIRDGELCARSVADYKNFLTKKGWKPSSICCEIKVIRAFARWCALPENEILSEDDALKVCTVRKPTVPDKEYDIINQTLALEVINAGTEPGPGDNARNKRIKFETQLALEFILTHGLRVHEVLQISGEDLHLNIPEPYVMACPKGPNGQKSKKVLTIPMAEKLKERVSFTRVFTFTEATANKSLKRGCKRLGIKEKITVHVLRRIWCTFIILNGGNEAVVSKMMGHKNINLTRNIYESYDLREKSRIINTYQDIVRNVGDIKMVVNNIIQAVNLAALNRDDRFHLEVNEKKKRMVITWD